MKRPVLLAAVVALVATACGPTSHLKLDLRSVSITVPRLVTPAVRLVPPPPAAPPAALPPIPAVDSALPPVSQPLPVPSAPLTAPEACPTAGPFDVPALPASPMVSAPPVDATSTQMSLGSYTGAAGKPSKGSLEGDVQMRITRLPSSTSSVGQKVDAWRVDRSGPAKGATSVEVYRLVHPSSSPAATQAGIYLVALAWKDPARGTVSFQASGNGLEIMSLPAQPSTNDTQYAGADTDPDTLTTLQLTRNIRGHKRIDACGKLIDTITVEMTGTLTTPDMQRQLAWTQQIATTYGAVDVAETLSLTSVDAGYTWTRSLRNTTVPALPKGVGG
jgi:hypothetical protein